MNQAVVKLQVQIERLKRERQQQVTLSAIKQQLELPDCQPLYRAMRAAGIDKPLWPTTALSYEEVLALCWALHTEPEP
jgi:hypothetical protein